jgi:hypothetical protein
MSNITITLGDLDAAEANGGGWGISTRRNLSDSLAALLGDYVVHQANQIIGLSLDDFALWTDSKLGRWLVDEAEIFDGQDTVDWTALEALVAKYLNGPAVQGLKDYGISNPTGVR